MMDFILYGLIGVGFFSGLTFAVMIYLYIYKKNKENEKKLLDSQKEKAKLDLLDSEAAMLRKKCNIGGGFYCNQDCAHYKTGKVLFWLGSYYAELDSCKLWK